MEFRMLPEEIKLKIVSQLGVNEIKNFYLAGNFFIKNFIKRNEQQLGVKVSTFKKVEKKNFYTKQVFKNSQKIEDKKAEKFDRRKEKNHFRDIVEDDFVDYDF
jgi:transcriptional regulatory protein LevR